MADARFGIGLYKYYADVAPALARFFRFLLLLPGGDREAGLRDMIGARDHGVLLRGEADYQLHWIYLWYEEQPRRAMALLRGLLKRYPQNPLFRRRIAEIEVEYFHDRGASLDAWLALMADARAGRVASAALALTVARLGAAEQLDARFETDRALELLTPIVQEQPQQPYGAVARATLLQADAYQRLGRRADAIRAYRAALAARPERDIWHIGDRARAGLGRSHDSKRAQAYARSLEGWRAFERGALAAAERALDRSIILAPDDPVTWYRRARVYQRRQQIDRALVAFGRVIGSRPVAPPVVLGPAYFHRGQILEGRGERTAAAAAFHAAARVFGVDDDVRISAERALSRLHSPTAER
jgi:tetratricopeptide (TPR) repeat protein